MLAALLALAAATQAPAAPVRDDQCFSSHDFQSFRPVNDHSFTMRLRSNQIYLVELQGSCAALLYPQAVMDMAPRGGSGLVCGPADWDVAFTPPGVRTPTPCIVKSQRRLTPEEVAALPSRERP